ncbi:MAG: hypothetical protein JNJ83_10875 [Verrucomicrobiaceae bacterium]|nr:hypothetical protein [Verrucomicrobiaceae bacterium]
MKYRLDNGSLVNTEKAVARYSEATDWDGSNWISRNTGSQWEHEKLYKSKVAGWYLEAWSQWQGSTPSARSLSEREAAEWLLLNDRDLPAELAQYAEIEG